MRDKSGEATLVPVTIDHRPKVLPPGSPRGERAAGESSDSVRVEVEQLERIDW